MNILKRQEHSFKRLTPTQVMNLPRILITGGMGSIGEALPDIGIKTDLIGGLDGFLDITDEYAVRQAMGKFKPEIIINLAGAKHAPEGEDTTFHTLDVNTIGVQNLIKWKPKGARIIQASTCKACNPETAYGASKLLAERMVLNDGGTVIRFYNVIETAGNVFEIWKEQSKLGKIKVTEGKRYFITLAEAVGLTVSAINLEPGRYTINGVQLVEMIEVAKELYPDLEYEMIPLRRGDRLNEKLHSTNEMLDSLHCDNSIVKIISYNDADFHNHNS